MFSVVHNAYNGDRVGDCRFGLTAILNLNPLNIMIYKYLSVSAGWRDHVM